MRKEPGSVNDNNIMYLHSTFTVMFFLDTGGIPLNAWHVYIPASSRVILCIVIVSPVTDFGNSAKRTCLCEFVYT